MKRRGFLRFLAGAASATLVPAAKLIPAPGRRFVGLDIAAFDFALKQIYSASAISSLAYADDPFFKMLQRMNPSIDRKGPSSFMLTRADRYRDPAAANDDDEKDSAA